MQARQELQPWTLNYSLVLAGTAGPFPEPAGPPLQCSVHQHRRQPSQEPSGGCGRALYTCQAHRWVSVVKCDRCGQDMCATATPTAKRYTSQSLSLSLPDTACCACTPLTHLPVRAPPSLIHLSCTPLTHPPVIAPPHTLNCLCMHPPCSPPVHAPPSLTRTRLCVHPLHSFSHLTVHTHTPHSLAQWLFCPARHISDPSPNTRPTPDPHLTHT